MRDTGSASISHCLLSDYNHDNLMPNTIIRTADADANELSRVGGV